MRPLTRVAGLVAVLLLAVACAKPRGSPGALSDLVAGQRPALDTDEAGLWMHMDRVEDSLKRSGRLVSDPVSNGYIREIVCKLAGAQCHDIRIYLVQTPHFNASMAPNGTMQVWTGLILRAHNEAQLAYVLGHEYGHYLRRHSLQLWRDARSKADVLVFFKLATAAAGYGFVGDLAELAALGSIFAFSRDSEREADELGFELMVQAGYDPREAPKLWEGLVKERDAANDASPFIFFATHPSSEARIATLTRMAQKAAAPGGQMVVGEKRFLEVFLPLRATLLREDLRRREFARSQVVLDRLFSAGVGLGELYFFQGELFRLRGNQGDKRKAIAAYQRAIETGSAPAETHRALGLVLLQAGEAEKARASFARYLQEQPEAEDREMIQVYLRQRE